MENITVKVLEVFDHFVSSFNGSTNGLYKITLNGENYTVFRNGGSWGILSHYVGEPVTKCIGLMREDRIKLVENAIDDYLIKH